MVRVSGRGAVGIPLVVGRNGAVEGAALGGDEDVASGAAEAEAGACWLRRVVASVGVVGVAVALGATDGDCVA